MSKSVVDYDSGCNLCSRVVRLVRLYGGTRCFEFRSLQAEDADTIVLREEGNVYTKSTAALRIARRLQLPWSLLYILIVVPRPWRDRLYDWVARHRYRWFGRCLLPPTRSSGAQPPGR